MGKAIEWVMKKTTNPYVALYDKDKSFLKNCEDVGAYRQEQRKKRRDEKRNIRRLKELREIEK